MKRIGIIESIKGTQGGIVVSGLPSKDFSIPVNAKVVIGFSAKFTEQLTIKRWKKSQANSAFVIFKEISSKEQAESMLEKGVYADEEKLLEWQDHIPEGNDIEGYSVFDDESGNLIGRVTHFLISPAHNIMAIKGKNGEILIPFNNEFVIKIDDNEEEIKVRLIDGLINLNTEAAENDESGID